MPTSKSKTSSKRNSSNRNVDMNVFEKLKEDHRNVEKLFQKILKMTEDDIEDREALFAEVNEALSAHADAEEKIFYPVTEEEENTRPLTLEAYEEHAIAKALLAELETMDKSSEIWRAKVKVLSEVVKHHVKEEEENLFPKAKKIIDKERSEIMGEEIEEEEERFKQAV